MCVRVPPVRRKPVASPPTARRRPSRNVAKCRHQTNARPSAAGLMSVDCPLRVRTKPVCVRERRRSEGRTRGKRRRDAALIRPRRERNARPPRTSSERRPCKGRVPSRICPSLARRKPVGCPPCVHSANDQRQMLEPTNDRTPPRTHRPSLPARQATLSTPQTVNRPFQARVLSVVCPFLVRRMSVVSPYEVRGASGAVRSASVARP